MKIIGPFSQILTMDNVALKGALQDSDLNVLSNVAVLIENGLIHSVGDFDLLKKDFPNADIEEVQEENVLLPGLIDSHTHICFAGSRAKDYAMRNAGKSYLEIAKEGGGIMDTVRATRRASKEELVSNTLMRLDKQLSNGITTTEVKSGYGLTVADELKMLEAIKEAATKSKSSVISTCLAAHIFPKDFDGSIEQYLQMMVSELFPQLLSKELSCRVDAFIEEEAFNSHNIGPYFDAAKQMGFDITVHADQFHAGGSKVAIEVGAISADHLEASTDQEIMALAESDVIAVALPGASIGLGCAFTPARKLLDAGTCLSIASDWNPGSGPMGDLLTSACVLQTFEKLSNAEVFAAITSRAAAALHLKDRGVISAGYKADLVAFPTADFREILYHQGQMKPAKVWINGASV